MHTSNSTRSFSRTAREGMPEPLSKTQRRHLERLFEQSNSESNISWSPAHNSSEVIDLKRLVKIQNSPKQREKNHSAVDDRIIINVSGDHYETHRATLDLYPHTLLGNDKHRKYYYDEIRKEYFFDRHRACFEAILYYYQSHGRLRRPEFVPIDIFLEEVAFFQLGQQVLSQIYKDENLKEVKKVHLPKNRIRRFLWAVTEYPTYSRIATVYNIISLLMALASAIGIAIESLPQYTHLDYYDCKNKTLNPAIYYKANQSLSNTNTCNLYFTSSFFILQCICIGFFTIEVVVRLLTTPSLLDYVKNPMNWVDVISIVPFYVRIGIHYASANEATDSQSFAILRPLRILRLARVFKFYQLFKNIKSLRALITTIRQSLLDFLIMIIILTLLSFILGAAAYFAENDTNGSAYDSIFEATYWGIMTITSVGYGDIVPITPIGRIVACICALLGAATIGMLVSVLVDRYQRVYARTLYINDEEIDFSDDESDDENDDTNSSDIIPAIGRRKNSKIEDLDARAKEIAMNGHIISDLPETSDIQLEEENPSEPNNNRVHFIIGYVDNENQETTRDLVRKLSHVVEEKQSSGDNVSLNIVSIEKCNTDNDDEDLTDTNTEYKIQGHIIKNCRFPVSKTEEEF